VGEAARTTFLGALNKASKKPVISVTLERASKT